MKIGFVGTGTMGAPIARCLIEAGHRLAVYDVRAEATAELCALGAVRAEHAAGAAREADIVFTSLPGPAEVEATFFAPQTGLLAGLRPGSAYIDMTTNTPGLVRRIAAAANERGIEALDAPVSGRPPAMTIMVGGPKAVFDKCLPVLQAAGRNIFHVGDSGAGCTAKLVTQYLGYSNFIAALEGLLIGAKAGIDLGILARIVPVSAGASRTFDNIPRAVLNGTFVSGGTLDIVAKDMALACELARDVAAPTHLGLLAADVYRRAQALGWGREGFPVVAKVLEMMAGCELRATPSETPAAYSAEDPRREAPKQ
jgi:3-hydroxyisobutyrate dehydrogenase